MVDGAARRIWRWAIEGPPALSSEVASGYRASWSHRQDWRVVMASTPSSVLASGAVGRDHHIHTVRKYSGVSLSKGARSQCYAKNEPSAWRCTSCIGPFPVYDFYSLFSLPPATLNQTRRANAVKRRLCTIGCGGSARLDKGEKRREASKGAIPMLRTTLTVLCDAVVFTMGFGLCVLPASSAPAHVVG